PPGLFTPPYFFFTNLPTTNIYTLSLHDALPIFVISNMYRLRSAMDHCESGMPVEVFYHVYRDNCDDELLRMAQLSAELGFYFHPDRKSTRLNSSHQIISYAVFCLKKKT